MLLDIRSKRNLSLSKLTEEHQHGTFCVLFVYEWMDRWDALFLCMLMNATKTIRRSNEYIIKKVRIMRELRRTELLRRLLWLEWQKQQRSRRNIQTRRRFIGAQMQDQLIYALTESLRKLITIHCVIFLFADCRKCRYTPSWQISENGGTAKENGQSTDGLCWTYIHSWTGELFTTERRRRRCLEKLCS